MQHAAVAGGRPAGAWRERVPEALYLVAAFLFLAEFFMGRAQWSATLIPRSPTAELALRLLLASLVLAKLLMEGHEAREWVLMATLVAAMGAGAWVSGARTLLWTAVFVVGAKGVSPRRLAVAALLPAVSILAITIVLNRLGMSEGITGIREGRVRPSLGFKNPNGLGMTCYQICMYLAVLWWQRRSRAHLVTTLLLLVPAWVVADCRSAAVGMVLVAILVQATSLAGPRLYEGDTQRRLAICCLALLVACIAASLWCVMAPDAPTGALARIDYLLSYRISLSQAYYQLYPPTMLGIDISGFPKVWLGIGEGFYRSFLMDIGYAHVLVRYGIIPFALHMGLLLALMVKAVRERHCNAVLLLMCTALVYGLVEVSPLTFGVCPLLAYMGTVIHGTPLTSLDLDVEGNRRRRGRHLAS